VSTIIVVISPFFGAKYSGCGKKFVIHLAPFSFYIRLANE
jgi:hypothetical protein